MNRKILMIGLVGLFAVALVSAALVTYYSQRQVNMEVESPIVLNGDLIESVKLIAGDGYRIYLVEGENKLDKSLDINFKLSLLDDVGAEVTDTTGFYGAYTDDIQYAYDPIYGNAADWSEAKTWMFANLDWFDWYLTNDVVDYDASVITNHGGNSAYPNVLAFNTLIPEDLEPGKFYAVVYLDVDAAVTPGNYTLSVDVIPA